MIFKCRHCRRVFPYLSGLKSHLDRRETIGMCPGKPSERPPPGERSKKSIYKRDHYRATHEEELGWTYADDTDDWT